MNISPAAELAVKGIRLLAEKGDDRPIPLDVICKEGKLSKQYLVKIFAMLAKANLIRPVRGKHGGYLLGRPAEDIRLLEIIEAIEGPMVLNFCQHNPPQCEEVDCPGRAMWAELQAIIRGKLTSVRLADLYRPSVVRAKA